MLQAFPHLPDLDTERRAAVHRLHRSVPVIDCHSDALQDVCAGRRRLVEASTVGYVDIPRALKAVLGCQVFALAVRPPQYGGPAHAILRQYETLMRELEAAPKQATLCRTAAAIEQAHAAGKLAAVLSLKGGEALEGDIDLLHTYYHLGVRMIGPVWLWTNELGGGACENAEPSGLTVFGRHVVREMVRLGITIDTAHLPKEAFWDILECTDGRSVICSHADVCGPVTIAKRSSRNLADEQIKALAGTGGVLGISISQPCLQDMGLPDLVRTFAHAADLVGPEHLGFGSGCDGARPPEGLEDISRLPRLTSALLDAGFTESELLGILGGNFLRVFRAVWGA